MVERDAAGEHECRQRVEVSQDDDCMGQFRQRPTVTTMSHALQQVQSGNSGALKGSPIAHQMMEVEHYVSLTGHRFHIIKNNVSEL